MFNEVNRALTDYLNDATNGINAQLTIMTSEGLYDSGDSQPADIGTIVDESRNREVARRFPPVETAGGKDRPTISVFIDDIITIGAAGISGGSPEVAQSKRDSTVSIQIRYYCGNPYFEQNIRDSYYYARACLKCIKQFDRNQTARTRNQIQFRQLQDMRFQPLDYDPTDEALIWYYSLTYIIRDNSP